MHRNLNLRAAGADERFLVESGSTNTSEATCENIHGHLHTLHRAAGPLERQPGVACEGPGLPGLGGEGGKVSQAPSLHQHAAGELLKAPTSLSIPARSLSPMSTPPPR